MGHPPPYSIQQVDFEYLARVLRCKPPCYFYKRAHTGFCDIGRLMNDLISQMGERLELASVWNDFVGFQNFFGLEVFLQDSQCFSEADCLRVISPNLHLFVNEERVEQRL